MLLCQHTIYAEMTLKNTISDFILLSTIATIFFQTIYPHTYDYTAVSSLKWFIFTLNMTYLHIAMYITYVISTISHIALIYSQYNLFLWICSSPGSILSILFSVILYLNPPTNVLVHLASVYADPYPIKTPLTGYVFLTMSGLLIGCMLACLAHKNSETETTRRARR